MVFCGKPSKGCAECRKRRIKCDQLDPACSQCKRAGKECTGYRDQLALLFRDESSKVVQKARAPSTSIEKRKASKKVRKSNDSSPISSTSLSKAGTTLVDSTWCSEVPLVSRDSTPLHSPISLCFDDLGINFFFAHYVAAGSNFSSVQSDPASSPIWSSLFVDKTFYDAVSSVGFAGLSNVTKDYSLMLVARNKYVTTLGRISSALQDPDKMDLADTFKAVLLLTAFEIVGGTSATGWGVHIDGGTALLNTMRKNAQPQEPRVRMLLQFCLSACVKCISNGESAPATIVEWCTKRKGYLNETDRHAFPLIEIISRFVNLHLAFKATIFPSSVVLEELLALEAELAQWDAEVPEVWKFTLEPAPEDPMGIAFNGQCHIYRDLWTARIYGHYRWCRILINELICAHISRTSSFSAENELRQKRSLETISNMATDICCSVLGQFHRHGAVNMRRKQMPPISAVFLLLYPLAVAGGAMGASEELHNWVVNILFMIGNTMGIQQALALIPIAKKHRQRWKTGDLDLFSLIT